MKKIIINEKSHNTDWQGKKLHFSTGKLAPHSDGSVVIRLGDTELLVTAVMGRHPDVNKDFLPFTVDFRESYSAAGKIGGGKYRKREGKPSDQAVLHSRLTDRPLRPLFPKGMVNDIVATITPLVVDKENDPGILCIIGSSLAVMLAGIPFHGPVGAVRIGYKDGQYLINPTYEEYKSGMLNLVVAGTKDTVNMIECDAEEVSDEIINQAFVIAQKEIAWICEQQEKFLSQCTIHPKTATYNKYSDEVMNFVKHILTDEKLSAMKNLSKNDFDHLYHHYERDVLEIAKEKIHDESHESFTEMKIKMAVFDCIKYHMRSGVLKNKVRLDGRGIEEIRPLYCEVGLLPRVHGVGLFQRGDTQILGLTTLGAPGDVEMSDTMEEEGVEKRYMHHYNMPPFSTNEAMSTRGTNRREIGHGRLAEKALEKVLPTREEFPYTIRVVSEALSSGGSTSMGAVCASTLSLMDAGVPIKRPVSGIAMGLITDHDDHGDISDYQVITDIWSIEDFMGDMDFKVAGTSQGITAIQLDIKIKGIPVQIVQETISRANTGRNQILNFMLETLDKPRTELNKYAPRIIIFKINPKKVKEVIGKGGETIDAIVRETGVKIDFEDDGTCVITGKSMETAKAAEVWIKDIAVEPQKGEVFEGKVTRVENYGVFVAFGRGKVGLCHSKNLGLRPTDSVTSHFKEGAIIKVSIFDIDQDGKIALKRVV